jgi:hypothetical protein
VHRSIRHVAFVGAVTLGSLLIASCGGGGNARLRLMNASPDEGSVDVVVDGKAVSNAVVFGTSSSYASVSSGSRHLQIDPTATTTPVVDESVSLGSGTDTTILLANFATSLNAITLQDDNSAPTSGNAKLRIINAAPGLTPADIYIAPDGTDINSVAPVISGMGFETASGYESLAAGTYRVWFTAPGQKFVFIDSGLLSLSAGQVRTLVGLSDSFGGYSSTVLADAD